MKKHRPELSRHQKRMDSKRLVQVYGRSNKAVTSSPNNVAPRNMKPSFSPLVVSKNARLFVRGMRRFLFDNSFTSRLSLQGLNTVLDALCLLAP